MKKFLLKYSFIALAVLAPCRPAQSRETTNPPPGTTTYTLAILPSESNGKVIAPTRDESLETVLNINNRLAAMGYDKTATLNKDDRVCLNIPSLPREKEQSFQKKLIGDSSIALHPVHLKTSKLLATGSTKIPGYILREHEFSDTKGARCSEKLFLTETAPITNDDFLKVEKDNTRPGIFNITLTDKGGEKFHKLTSRMQKGQERIAVVVNGRIVTAPIIIANLHEAFQISGTDNKSAEILLTTLSVQRASPLKFKVKFMKNQETTSP